MRYRYCNSHAGEGSVTDMATQLGCGHFYREGSPAYRVEGRRRRVVVMRTGRRRTFTESRFLLCETCWQAAQGTPTGLGPHGVDVFRLYGGWTPTEAKPCEGCGLLVVRGANTRTKHHTCSRSCTAAVSKAKRNTVSRPVTRCQMCREAVEGRADAAFCSSACRQRAYRIRNKYGLSVDEFTFMAAVGDYEPAQFDQALSAARAAGDLSHDAVVAQLHRLSPEA